ncbi:MAG TPA: PH domain-containing protein [Mycobacteriales bacterium]
MSEPRRLDWRTVISRSVTLSALRRQWGLVIGLIAIFGAQGGFRALGLAFAVLVVLVATVGAALVEWLRTAYAVDGDRLVVERGLLRRSLTVVPLDRIRGVDVQASALQRLLGIATVRVDAAATGGDGRDEAVLDAVNAADAGRLRDLLLREAAAAPRAMAAETAASEAAAPGPGEVLARFRPAWLLYAPLVGGYLVAPLAALGALYQLLGDVRLRIVDEERVAGVVESGPAAIALLVLAAAVLSVLGAVVTAAVANWGFTLVRRGGTLVAERGLLSTRQVTLEHDRIRGYALAEPPALRAARAARLTALVTGLGGDDERGDRGRRGQLLPLGPARVARSVAARAVFPFAVPLRPHPPAARRRRLVRALLPGVLVLAAAALARWGPGIGAGLVLLAGGLALGLDGYRGLGHALDERAVSVRSGSLRRRTVVLERRGVVGWTVRQSFFQRRSGLATVTVATGAGSGGYDALDIGAADGVALMAAVDPVRVRPLSGAAEARPTLER